MNTVIEYIEGIIGTAMVAAFIWLYVFQCEFTWFKLLTLPLRVLGIVVN